MSNITIATICLAVYGVCCVTGGVLMIFLDKDTKVLDKLVEKLKELQNQPSCGPVVDKKVSIRWLLDYIKELRG